MDVAPDLNKCAKHGILPDISVSLNKICKIYFNPRQ